jgi:hypothetical protein
MKLNKTTALIAADLLNMAANIFINHSCNDYAIDKTINGIRFAINTFNYDQEKQEFLDYINENSMIILSDVSCMRYCAKELEEYAKEI